MKKINEIILRAEVKAEAVKRKLVAGVRGVFSDDKGESYVDTGVKILISVVIGGLLLTGLYALFNTSIIPTMKTKIMEMFNYAG